MTLWREVLAYSGRAADGVGATSVVLGGLLAADPSAWGRRLGLSREPSRNRRLGVVDAGLGLTILAGRWVMPNRRWVVVLGRSALHVVFAREYCRNRNTPGAVGMWGLFVVDATISVALRARTSPKCTTGLNTRPLGGLHVIRA